jgi:U3 small nucleolar RNA-associated protein 25
MNGHLQIRIRYNGTLSNIVTPIKQIYLRITSPNLTSLADIRYNYFINELWPKIKNKNLNGHTCIFISSYFDYIRIRNYFKSKHINYVNCCEYTKNSELSRSRSAFFHGTAKFMLLTERFYFFRRYHIRGIQHLIFYQLPLNSHFYSELVNLLPSNNSSVISLYARQDLLALERIVGTERATTLIKATNNTHMFC